MAVARDRDALAAALLAHAERAPSGSAARVSPLGLAFSREPDVFAAVGAGATLGLGILLSELCVRRPAALRAPELGLVAVVVAGLSFVVAGLLIARLGLNSLSAFVASSEGGEVVCATRALGRDRRRRRFDARRIVSVDVVRRDERLEVVLRGPRHEVIARVFRLRALDPDALAAWLAEGVALVARDAGAEPPRGP